MKIALTIELAGFMTMIAGLLLVATDKEKISFRLLEVGAALVGIALLIMIWVL